MRGTEAGFQILCQAADEGRELYQAAGADAQGVIDFFLARGWFLEEIDQLPPVVLEIVRDYVRLARMTGRPI